MQKVFKGYTCLNHTGKPHTLTIHIAQCLFSCKTSYGYKFVFANCIVNVYTANNTYRVIKGE